MCLVWLCVPSLQMCASRSSGSCLAPVGWRSWFWITLDSKREDLFSRQNKLSAHRQKNVSAFIWVYILSNLQISGELFPPRINTHTHTHVHDCAWTCIMKAVFDALQWFCSEVGGCPGPQPQLRSHHPQPCQQPPGGQRYQYPHRFTLI